MLKVSFAGEHHRDSMLVCGGDNFVIFFRAAGLDYRSDTGLGGIFDVVREREERIRSHRAALRLIAGSLERDQAGLNAVHLSSPYTQDFFVLNQHDGITLCMLGGKPGDP